MPYLALKRPWAYVFSRAPLGIRIFESALGHTYFRERPWAYLFSRAPLGIRIFEGVPVHTYFREPPWHRPYSKMQGPMGAYSVNRAKRILTPVFGTHLRNTRGGGEIFLSPKKFYLLENTAINYNKRPSIIEVTG